MPAVHKKMRQALLSLHTCWLGRPENGPSPFHIQASNSRHRMFTSRHQTLATGCSHPGIKLWPPDVHIQASNSGHPMFTSRHQTLATRCSHPGIKLWPPDEHTTALADQPPTPTLKDSNACLKQVKSAICISYGIIKSKLEERKNSNDKTKQWKYIKNKLRPDIDGVLDHVLLSKTILKI